MPAISPTANIAASPLSRRKALLLACLIPLCGLQRMYVGRIKTGMLWMLTGGMLLVGQGLDVLHLLRGRFRDAAGRVLVNWRSSFSREVAPAGEAVNGYSTIPAAQAIAVDPGRWFNQSLGAIGGLVFGLALLLGLTLAVGLPKAIADGVFGTHMAREFQYSFGMADWPRLVDQIGNFLAGVLGVAGLGMVLFARRDDGSRHMMRALLGAAGFMAAVLVFAEACYYVRWVDVASHIDQNRIGPAVDAVINAGHGQFTGWTLLATTLFAASVFVLAWPPPRHTPSPDRSNLQEPAHHGIA